MKVDLTKFLTVEQQEEIYKIVKNFKEKIKLKEMTYNEAFMEIKYSSNVRGWLNSIEDIDGLYDSFLPDLQNILLKGYNKIFKKLIDKGVIIASNAGTQLGVVRDKKLIKWDDDIDLVMDIKDFNKYKWHLKRKAILNGWIPWVRNWLKDDFSTYHKKGKIWVQFFSLKRIKFDFGKFTSSFFPFIDLFPAIRVKEGIVENVREDISVSLVDYYDSCVGSETQRLLKNKRIMDNAKAYHEKLSKLDENSYCDLNKTQKISEIIKKNYVEDSNTFFQLHVMSPLMTNYTYENFIIRSIVNNNNEYKFIISDNHIEQFTKEYGENWEKPRRSHVHFILIWFVKFKKGY